MLIGRGHKEGLVADVEVREFVSEVIAGLDIEGKRILALIPDSTRTAPVGLMFRTLADALKGCAAKLDFLIALGTHRAMKETQILKLLEMTAKERRGRYGDIEIFNHAWDDPRALETIGTLSAREMDRLTEGRYARDVPVQINRLVLDYDHLFIVGPTFPHEVVGFSGGYKYLFPGICGAEFLNFFHWLGALVTNWKINGIKDTVVRHVIDRAAEFVRVPITNFGLVVTEAGLKGLYIGETRESWSAAADLSAKVHIRYMDHAFKKVLGIAPEMYDDLWTGGKVMYKLEPVVADGGDLIIYAPHITEVSYTHGRLLDKIGYHCLGYFREQLDKFADVPGGVMAHSTHVKGLGTYCKAVEKPRINVILATGIPEERCRRINLGYMDPASIRIDEWHGREDEGILVVDHAGEVLHRLKSELMT
ncbi:MAG TPA: lactate racemase domain-containing protein [Phycisphaerae bacterium]|nr:lactate racemase domain-containing protein [Phycisphaerae bacterium]